MQTKLEMTAEEAMHDPIHNAFWNIEDAIFGNIDLDDSSERDALMSSLNLLMDNARAWNERENGAHRLARG